MKLLPISPDEIKTCSSEAPAGGIARYNTALPMTEGPGMALARREGQALRPSRSQGMYQ